MNMKYLGDDRDPRAAAGLLERIGGWSGRPATLLVVVGGQVGNLLRSGHDRALPGCVELVHGPSCAASALPSWTIDRAASLARSGDALLCVPGDLLRVPGARGSLESARAEGADIRPVYSPFDALALARKEASRRVVALAAGFETTAPATAAAILEAERLGLGGFGVLVAHLRVVPGIAAAVAQARRRIDAVLAPGAVAALTGLREYESLAAGLGIPVVVTGPAPLDLLEGIEAALRQLARGESGLVNQYARAVRRDGNGPALAAMKAVFEPDAADWHGLGRVAGGGLRLRDRFRRFDAATLPGAAETPAVVDAAGDDRACGDVASGRSAPSACRWFGRGCAPEHPLGTPMASPEGTCLAYHRYRRPVPSAREAALGLHHGLPAPSSPA